MNKLNRTQQQYVFCMTLPLYNKRIIDTRIIPHLTHDEKVKLRNEIFGLNVATREDVLNLFGSLESNKNIFDYEKLRQTMQIMSPAGVDNFMQSLFKNKEKHTQASIAEYFKYRLPEAGISAFYLARSVYYARFAGGIGLLPKNEAIDYMRDRTVVIQKSYASWQDYFIGYYAGYIFSRYDSETLSSVYNHFENFAAWLFSKNLPDWKTLL